jgi:hypothetical protein
VLLVDDDSDDVVVADENMPGTLLAGVRTEFLHRAVG